MGVPVAVNRLANCYTPFTLPFTFLQRETIKYKSEVCVQLPTSAVNVALPALLLCTVLRPCAAVAPGMQQSIDITPTRQAGPQQQTRHTLLQWKNGTERRKDRH